MKESIKTVKTRRTRRTNRVRATLKGTSARPRLSVFFSLAHASVQFIDDETGHTLLNVRDTVTGKKKGHITVAQAHELGKKVAEASLEKGIASVIFDRGSRAYHGRIKALAEGAREGGLKF